MNEKLRALFPITEHVVYLNHAAVSPPPRTTIDAIQSQLNDVAAKGSLNFRSWVAVKEESRKLVASMIGARPEQVAFMRNTSDGLSCVANGLKWNEGDNIVTFRGEFPSNVYPWLRIRNTRNVEVRMCEERDGRVDPDLFISLINKRTRIVALSHVQYASGFRSDLERIGRAARNCGALFVVDAIQAMGVLPINVEAELVDVLAGAGHKWLLAPEGVGILYLSDRARELVEPTLVGWVSVPHPEDYNNFNQGWNQGALAWETGTGPAALLYGLGASLRLLLETGIPSITAYLEEVTDYLCERLESHGDYRVASSRREGEKSQIVCIQHKFGLSPLTLYKHLKERGIVTAPRGERLRISPHFYNSSAEIDDFIRALP